MKIQLTFFEFENNIIINFQEKTVNLFSTLKKNILVTINYLQYQRIHKVQLLTPSWGGEV